MAPNQLVLPPSSPRYDTEITHEHHMKYKNPPSRDPFLGGLKEKPLKMKYAPNGLFYYPNDRHMIAKTCDGVIMGTLLGLPSAFVVVNNNTNFRGNLKTVLPVAAEGILKYATPCVIAGGVYGLVTSFATNKRDVEDATNHLLGGAAGSSVFGMWFKSVRLGFWGSVTGGLLAGGIKYLDDLGYPKSDQFFRSRMFNMYRRYWFTDPVPVEGSDDDEVPPRTKKFAGQ